MSPQAAPGAGGQGGAGGWAGGGGGAGPGQVGCRGGQPGRSGLEDRREGSGGDTGEGVGPGSAETAWGGRPVGAEQRLAGRMGGACVGPGGPLLPSPSPLTARGLLCAGPAGHADFIPAAVLPPTVLDAALLGLHPGGHGALAGGAEGGLSLPGHTVPDPVRPGAGLRVALLLG